VTSPAPNSTLSLGTDPELSVPIDYVLAATVDGGVIDFSDGGYDTLGVPFELRGPGSCNGRSDCGHVALQIDGSACDQPGVPYNDTGAYGPIEALFAFCCSRGGAHTFTLAVVDDQGNPIQGQGSSLVVSLPVSIEGSTAGASLPCQCSDGGSDAACPADSGAPEDGGLVDGGSMDGGTIDGGPTDGGSNDGGPVDGGGLTDGGAVDAGSPDAGVTDGGVSDGGASDAGLVDGGTLDGGPQDAGGADAGADAGTLDGGSPDGG
jgi:hypothetical protein